MSGKDQGAAPASVAAQDRAAQDGATRARIAWERGIRLWSGLVLMAFVTTHLANHALGVFGLGVLDYVQDLRWGLWHEQPGVSVLLAAFAAHFALGLKSIARRRTWRMPLEDWAQILLGLAVPVLLAGHLASTRLLNDFYGAHEYYAEILVRIWPHGALWQAALVLVVWTHGCIGINFALKGRVRWRRWKPAALGLAVLVPMMALSGFVASARDAVALSPAPDALTPVQMEGLRLILSRLHGGLAIIAIGLAAAVAWQASRALRAGSVTVRYTGHGERKAAPGVSLLETSRKNNIPHPSLCGGRARCSTCRVLVTEGLDKLAPPQAAERKLLARIGAPAGVRLACQIKPTHDLSAQILLPAIGKDYRTGRGHFDYQSGVQRDAAVLFVDIRAFNTLSRQQPPHELIALLNRFIAEMSQAVEAHGGQVDMVLSDGLMAVFGLSTTREKASRAAILAARDMLRAVRALNLELGSAIPMPVRVGIGIHVGPVIVAENHSASGAAVNALGETVSIASRLEAATKEVLADCLVSVEAAEAAAAQFGAAARREIHMRGRDAPVAAYALTDGQEIEIGSVSKRTDALETVNS